MTRERFPSTDQEVEGSNPSGRAITHDCSIMVNAENQRNGKTIEFLSWESIGKHLDAKPGRHLAVISDR